MIKLATFLIYSHCKLSTIERVEILDDSNEMCIISKIVAMYAR